MNTYLVIFNYPLGLSDVIVKSDDPIKASNLAISTMKKENPKLRLENWNTTCVGLSKNIRFI